MCFFDKNVSIEPQFYNYPSPLKLPNHSSITTCSTHYGSYRTVQPFDSPTQNTINYTMEFVPPHNEIVYMSKSHACISIKFMHILQYGAFKVLLKASLQIMYIHTKLYEIGR